MKTNLVFLLLFILLGGFLFLSNRYDHQKNARKIAFHNCNKTEFNPFPASFTVIDPNGKKFKSSNRYDNGQLNYQGIGFSNLPDDLFKNYSTCIKVLDLTENKFNEIPSTIRYLKKLRTLDLSSSKLRSLTSANNFDDKLPELRTLNLELNEITLLDFLPITDEPLDILLRRNKISKVDLPRNPSAYNVKNIDLSSNSFKKFPIELFRIKNISMLNLNHNRISSIPELTKSDYEINHISLAKNRLEQFPYQLSKVKNLYFIDLSSNQIRGLLHISGFQYLRNLGITFQQIDSVIITQNALPNMTDLNLNNNRINYFEIKNDNNQGIATLNLSKNRFKNFPTDVLKLKNLSDCNLSNNKIEIFDIANFPKHQNLKIFDLHSNYLQEIKGIEQLVNLEILDLHSNALKEVNGIEQLINLTEVHLHNNDLKEIKGIEQLVKLKSIDLSDNLFSAFPVDALKCNGLATLNLSNNRISGAIKIDSIEVSSLTKLNLTRNDLVAFPKDLLKCPILEKLNLSDNIITGTIKIDSIEVSSLNELNLSGNQLVKFPYDLLKLKIELLDLANNQIEGIVNIKNTDVTEINLSENNISTIYVTQKNKIKKLFLQDNELVELFFDKGSVQYLEVLDLSNNTSLEKFPFEIFENAPRLKKIYIVNCENISQKDIDKIITLASRKNIGYSIR